MKSDINTANAFAFSWNSLPMGSIYTFDQFEDWFLPLTEEDFKDKNVLELGCGNASLLMHATRWNPSLLVGLDLGDSVVSARDNMQHTGFLNFKIEKADLIKFRSDNPFDLVYSIGVLHHLIEPIKGFTSVIENTKSGGQFHCWVYAKEGNEIVRYLVDPLRKMTSKLPWWFIKFLIATPLAFVYYLYAHVISRLKLSFMPLYTYSTWITKRNFPFFRHVAFDQLVTPQTVYISKKTIEDWLLMNDKIKKDSTYIFFRNGNSWKFGGKIR